MENITKQRIAVRAVIIRDDGKILLIRESEKYEGGTQIGLYDFPGGKVEIGESCIDAIKREVFEEIGINIEVGDPFYVDEWRPIIGNEKLQIIGIFFKCKPLSENVSLSNDYNDSKWINVSEISAFPLMEKVKNAIKKLL